MKLRPYQIDAHHCAWDKITPKRGRTAVVLPTGMGKTIIMAATAKRWTDEGLGNVLILANRRELIGQTAEKFKRYSGRECLVEMASSRANAYSLNTSYGHQVVVGSVQTMQRKRLAKWPRGTFSLVIQDECHFSVATTFRTIVEYFNEAAVVGFTATPDRTDGQSIFGTVYDDCCYDTMDLKTSIGEGWLVPILHKSVHVDCLGFDVLPERKGDFTDAQVAGVVDQDEVLRPAMEGIVEGAGDRPTLVFMPSVPSAKHASEILNAIEPDSSAYVASYMLDEENNQLPYPPEDREREIEKFKAGQRKRLVSMGVFCYGFDAPACACVANLRPTKSRPLYAQCVGRGTRPLDGTVDQWETAEERRAAIARSAKPDLLVLDFVGNASRHELVHGPSALMPAVEGIEPLDLAAALEVIERLNAGKPLDAAQAMDDAANLIARARAERMRKLRESIVCSITASFVDVDFGRTHTPRVSLPPSPNGASDKQVDYILKLATQQGKQWDEATVRSWQRGKAMGILNDLVAKRNAGPPSPAMVYRLRKEGLPVPATWHEAHKALDRQVQHA